MSWLNAINPVGAIADEDQAIRAARAAAIALFLGGIYALLLTVLTATNGADGLRAYSDAVAAESDMAGQGALLANGVIWLMTAFGLLQLAAGVGQWVRPGVILPIIVMILVIWGLVQTILTLGGGEAARNAETIWIKLALLMVQALLCLSAIRGASALDRFRKARNAPA